MGADTTTPAASGNMISDSVGSLAGWWTNTFGEGAGATAKGKELDAKLDAKYPKLSSADIKTLVLEDKWMKSISIAMQSELDRVSQTITGRIRELNERYGTTLPKLSEEMNRLTTLVDASLKKMARDSK